MVIKSGLLKKVIVFLGCSIMAFQIYSAHINDVLNNYIDNYKDISIAEMERTGIPASIKLAQAILESNMGLSELAVQANNHFGIKCGNQWNGTKFYHEDDDMDDDGKLVASCFRAFDSVYESFIAHSDFLMASNRYGFLFEYNSKDYKSWAVGLRKAGYATDRQYSQKLISIIEKYGLHQYDRQESRQMVHNKKKEEEKAKPFSRLLDLNESTEEERSAHFYKKYENGMTNHVPFVIAFGGETLEDLAQIMGISSEELLLINEELGYEKIILEEGEKIHLKTKKSKYMGKEEFHTVREGETMYSISQLYGIKLVNLYARNKMPRGSEPLPGEKVFLKATPSREERPAYHKHPRKNKESILFGEDFYSSVNH